MAASGMDAMRLLHEQGASLYALFLRLTLREEAAEDLLQDLFLKLSTDAEAKWTLAKSPAAYVRRMAVNLAFDWRRTHRRRHQAEPLSEEIDAKVRSPLQAIVQDEQAELIIEELDGLTEPMRQAIVLRYLQGESYELIGTLLEKTAKQSRAICHAGLRQIRRRLKERERRVLHVEPNAQ